MMDKCLIPPAKIDRNSETARGGKAYMDKLLRIVNYGN